MCAALIIASAAGAYVEVKAIDDVKDCKAYWEEVGEESTANLNKLEDGINTLSENHDSYISGKAQLAQGEKDYAAGVLKLENGRQELADGIAQYNSGKKTLAATEKAFGGKGCPVLKTAYDGVNELKAGYSNSKAYATVAAKGGSDYSTVKNIYEGVANAIQATGSKDAAVAAVAEASVVKQVNAQESEIIEGVTAAVRQNVTDGVTETVKAMTEKIAEGIKSEQASIKAKYKEENPDATDDEAEAYVKEQISKKTEEAINQKISELVEAQMASEEIKSIISNKVEEQKQNLIEENLPAAKGQVDAAYTNVKMLVSPHSQSEAVDIAAQASGLPEDQMSQAYNGYIQYTEGVAKLKAAEGQLAAGRVKLANGEKELVDGRLKLMDGRKQLKEFEDGRAQVADGLETAIATKPDGGVQSIKSRLGENFDYLAKDGENLNYKKAMSVVDAARAYQDDSTEVVTAELTGRIVGAVAGLAATLFGIIASILTLLGLRKTGIAAAVISVIAAIVCAVKVASAGTAISAAAGSTIGMMPVVIAVIGAVIAAVVVGTSLAKN